MKRAGNNLHELFVIKHYIDARNSEPKLFIDIPITISRFAYLEIYELNHGPYKYSLTHNCSLMLDS